MAVISPSLLGIAGIGAGIDAPIGSHIGATAAFAGAADSSTHAAIRRAHSREMRRIVAARVRLSEKLDMASE